MSRLGSFVSSLRFTGATGGVSSPMLPVRGVKEPIVLDALCCALCSPGTPE